MSQKKWTIKAKRTRPSRILATGRPKAVIATYTLDKNYVYSYPVDHSYWQERKVQPLGSVLAFNPTTQKAVPNFTTYGFGELGILLNDADCTDADQEVGVIIQGYIREDRCWDNGDYGSVLAATKTALAPRVTFVDIGSRGMKGVK